MYTAKQVNCFSQLIASLKSRELPKINFYIGSTDCVENMEEFQSINKHVD